MKKIYIVIPGIIFLSCLPGIKKSEEPSVIIAHQKEAYRFSILLKDMNLKVEVAPQGDLPYSSNASAAIWVGERFPFDKAVEVITLSRNYYKEIRYISLYGRNSGLPEMLQSRIYVGGDTETALGLGLKAWTEKDFSSLKKVKSLDEFHNLIRSKYSN